MPQGLPYQTSFSYKEYLAWSGDERWELIAGEAFAMSPAPSRLHQEVVGALFNQIANFLRRGPCKVYVAPFDVRLPVGNEPDEAITTVVQPDISVICDRRKLDDAGCRGAPDWIVEVASPSTLARDTVQKRDLYERHGVHEYWIVEPSRRSLTIFRSPRPGEPFAPPVVAVAKGTANASVLPGLSVDWDLVFPDPPAE